MPPHERAEQRLALLEKAQQIYLKYGITTVQDGSTNASGFQKLAECAKEQVFHLDVVSYVLADDLEKTAEEYPEYYQKYHNRLKIGGAKIILDGSPQGRSAWLRKPYEGEKTYCGYPAHTQEETDRWVEMAVEKMPTVREIRAPKTTRVNTHRP